jgi:undecaprenyl-diphosphatase
MLLLLFILIIFWRIADEIVVEKENNFDTLVFQKLSFLTSPFTTRLMLFFTFFGSNKFLFPAYTLITAYFLFYKKNMAIALNIAAIGISSAIVLNLVKDIFRRTRPFDPLIPNVNGFSFPSGHSFSAFTFGGILIYILWQSDIKKGWKYVWSILLILFSSCIAFSRVYLHVHYPSDVIGGFCLSMLWLSISFLILNKITARFKT